MGSNTFGNIFKITTFGESHGLCIGVVIDGCPAGIAITEKEINLDLEKRRPNRSKFVSQRAEKDKAKIVSGVFKNITTGAPICILIENTDVDSSYYDEIKDILRPSHFNYSYLQKYGFYDHRGSARASARETATRVAAATIAKKVLKKYKIKVYAYLKQVGDICVESLDLNNIDKSPIFCPDKTKEKLIIKMLKDIQEQKDSIGGIVGFWIEPMIEALGEPVYKKLTSVLASAMMSIPGAKGFEIGDGFKAALKKGSERNDLFILKNKKIQTKTNNEGGVLAGISTGMPLYGSVVFKPTSTIKKDQETLDLKEKKTLLKISKKARLDACIAIRAVPVVEAMLYLVLADKILMNKTTRL